MYSFTTCSLYVGSMTQHNIFFLFFRTEALDVSQKNAGHTNTINRQHPQTGSLNITRYLVIESRGSECIERTVRALTSTITSSTGLSVNEVLGVGCSAGHLIYRKI